MIRYKQLNEVIGYKYSNLLLMTYCLLLIYMEFTNAAAFLNYYSKVKKRTKRLFPYIPPDKIEWTYQEGKFTVGDLIRHLANSERYIYAETIQQKPSAYDGCSENYASGYDKVLQFYEDQCPIITDLFFYP